MDTVIIPQVFARFGFWHSDPERVSRGNGLKEPFDVSPFRMVRRDGDQYLMVSAGRDGLPYGRMPKLILALLATMAVRTDSREIILPNAKSTLAAIGIEGQNPKYNVSLEAAIRRLLGCRYWHITHQYGDNRDIADGWAEAIDKGLKIPDHYAMSEFRIAEDIRLFDKDGEPVRLWKDREPMRIVLSEEFFAAAKAGVELDANTWHSISGSAIALDVYSWINQRASKMGAAEVPSGALCRQLGFVCKPHEAKAKTAAAVESIKEFWGSLEVEFKDGYTKLGGGPNAGWYAAHATDGAIVLVTDTRHVKVIAQRAQEAGYQEPVAETKTEKAMGRIAESSPADWKEAFGGWGL
ncbi:replication protein RepA [Azospirillum brasilense]|uniref:replication protein RepA n=1 Tax=Azospirillum brasilense TaxID=192 RepID=UPI00157A8C6D|nr:replication protein RepA [Azospirillum brasilense]